MTKKHFIAIAAQIADEMAASPEARPALSRLARTLCIEFRGINPNFDRGRFLDACGVQQ